ncbi:MAG: sulfotransferase family protein [Azonexus sp.]
MKDDPIFVLSQPRAGSTLVQRLLNLDPGVLVMGEHGGPFHKIAYAYQRFEQIRQKGDTKYFMDADEADLMRALKTPDSFAAATAGGVRTEDIRAITRMFIQAIGNPLRKEDVRWGFKEVVTSDVGWAICDLYPKAQIVCLIRDPVRTIDSIVRTGWWGRDLNWICREVWLDKFHDFHNLAANFPGQVMVLRHERLETDLPDIFKWLGLEWTKVHQDMLDGEHVGSAETVGQHKNPLDEAETAFVREVCKDYFVT